MSKKTLKKTKSYADAKHPANKVRVFNRSGYFHVEYNMPMMKDRKESRSLHIAVDEKLAKNSAKDTNWWKESAHKGEIRDAIYEARDRRIEKIWDYLNTEGDLSKEERDSEYEWVIEYLLARDKPIIAQYFFAVLRNYGLDKVFFKIPKKELVRLNITSFMQGGEWLFERCEDHLGKRERK